LVRRGLLNGPQARRASIVIGMVRRRATAGPLADRTHPHWLVVSDMQGQILDCEPVTAAADPWTVLAAAMQRLSAAGWTIENDGRRGHFFCHREGVRRFVHLRPTDDRRRVSAARQFPQEPRIAGLRYCAAGLWPRSLFEVVGDGIPVAQQRPHHRLHGREVAARARGVLRGAFGLFAGEAGGGFRVGAGVVGVLRVGA